MFYVEQASYCNTSTVACLILGLPPIAPLAAELAAFFADFLRPKARMACEMMRLGDGMSGVKS